MERDAELRRCLVASMRPEDFSPGGPMERDAELRRCLVASMRPEDFSPGGVADTREQHQIIHGLQ